jgi:hypothetical protein
VSFTKADDASAVRRYANGNRPMLHSIGISGRNRNERVGKTSNSFSEKVPAHVDY